jgi:hypothetical protein
MDAPDRQAQPIATLENSGALDLWPLGPFPIPYPSSANSVFSAWARYSYSAGLL